MSRKAIKFDSSGNKNCSQGDMRSSNKKVKIVSTNHLLSLIRCRLDMPTLTQLRRQTFIILLQSRMEQVVVDLTDSPSKTQAIVRPFKTTVNNSEFDSSGNENCSQGDTVIPRVLGSLNKKVKIISAKNLLSLVRCRLDMPSSLTQLRGQTLIILLQSRMEQVVVDLTDSPSKTQAIVRPFKTTVNNFE